MLFACFLVVLWCFELRFVALIALCFCVGTHLCPSRILFLDAYTSCILHWSSVGHAFILMLLCFIYCMFGWSFALLYDHCGYFHMTVICLINLLICFTTYLLDCILLVTLYLSFYYLLYFEGLMRFVQMFQDTGIVFQVHHKF